MGFDRSFSGKPFNIEGNIVRGSVSGSWTIINDDTAINKSVRIQGVYWDASDVGSVLKLRDPSGGVWYHAICTGGEPFIDLFSQHLTLFTPFEYYDSKGNNTIIIYGEYV